MRILGKWKGIKGSVGSDRRDKLKLDEKKKK